MNFSEIYKRSDTHRLPVDPIAVAKALGVKVVSYRSAVEFFDVDIRELYERCPLGFSFRENDTLCIALNENACGERRRRFTAAHELAHCVLGHLDRDGFSTGAGRGANHNEERAADQFAADLLAPLVVLHDCGVRSAEEISRACGISRQAAEIRLERLIARDMNGFCPDEDELRVREMFFDFIKSFN